MTATASGVTRAATLAVTYPGNAAPRVATPAAANPNPVSGKTTSLSVLGADDDDGESNLIYTWSTTGDPLARVAFSNNNTNAAKACTATFTAAGNYSLECAIIDSGFLTAISSVTLMVNQTETSMSVTPSSATVDANKSQQFSASEGGELHLRIISRHLCEARQ